MKTLGIMFEQAQDIVNFVDAINRFDCPIDLKNRRLSCGCQIHYQRIRFIFNSQY